MAQEPNAHPPQTAAPKPAAAAPKPDPKAEQAAKDARAAASIGAQIILDYNAPAGVAARGGAGGSVEENTMIRDAHLVALGLDPRDCSGPPPSKEMIAARRKKAEEDAKAAADGPHQPAHATKASSLAADLGDDAQPQNGDKKAA